MEHDAIIIPKRQFLSGRRDTGTTLSLGKQVRLSESLIQGFLFLCGFMTIFTTIAIVVVLGRESLLLVTSEYIDEGGQIHTHRRGGANPHYRGAGLREHG